MNIKELIKAAKDTKVTHEQVARLRVQLKTSGNEQRNSNESSTKTSAFLSRTYSL